MPLFPTTTEWVAPDVFPNLSTAAEIAVDLETCDPNMENFGPGWPRRDGYIVGYALAVDGWKGYFPVRHEGGGNLDRGRVERFVRDVMALPCPKIMHNAAYDLGWLLAEGFTVNGPVIDTMIAAPLLDENRFSYALNSLGFDYLHEAKSEQGLRTAAADFGVHPKKELWKLPAMYVGTYAEQDAALTLKLWQHFKVALRTEEVESIFELESKVLPVLVKMTMDGVPFDRVKCERLIGQLQQREKVVQKSLKEMAGFGVDVWAAQSIANAFDRLNLTYSKTANGQPSFTKGFLDSCDHPIAKLIVEAREVNKTHSTFLLPYLKFSEKTGRIHPHVNQLRSDDGGTITGRLSMSQPNLQQVPARHEIIGPMVRGLFLPEHGQFWASNDFSTQEPRLLLHYASLLGLPGADSMVQAYRGNPNTDFHQMIADMAGIKRKTAKTIGLGLCIAEGELVLTDKGLVPIEQVTEDHKVWDGIEWVSHEGVIFMGTKEVITYGNLTATPDHNVWTVESGKIPLGVAASRLDALVSTGNAEQAIRYVDHREQGHTTERETSIRKSPLRMWRRRLEAFGQPEEREIHSVLRLCMSQAASGTGALVGGFQPNAVLAKKGNSGHAAMPEPQGQGLEELRGTWDSLRVLVSKGLRGLSAVLASSLRVGRHDDRSNQQRGELCGREHSEVVLPREQPEQKKYAKVYDILNAGPRHRFTVSSVLVSNCYGMGKAKLADQLDLPLDEASDLIEQFHSRVPFLKGTINAVMKRIENPASGGAIRTLLGRKCRFPLWEPTEWGVYKALPREQAVMEYGPRIKRAGTYKGLNRLIQGSAADQTKAAMVALADAGYRVMLQVHDEIIISADSREHAEQGARIMTEAVKLEVPSRCDVEIGPNWGEAS